MRNLLFIVACIFGMAATGANAQVPPIDAYGQLPTIKSIDLSPDGSSVAYLLSKDGTEAMSVFDFSKGPIAAVGTGGLKARFVHFAGINYVVIVASDYTRVRGFRGRFENSAAFSVNLDKQKPIMLGKNTPGIYPAQTGFGQIVGMNRSGEKVYMPAFVGTATSSPLRGLLEVNLDNGRGKVYEIAAFGKAWFVNRDGVVLAREDYLDSGGSYEIFTKKNGDWESVYGKQVPEYRPLKLTGYKKDESALIVIDQSTNANFTSMHELNWDGQLSPPIFARSDADIDEVLTDLNGVVYGVQYGGLYPTYDFFDDSVDESMETAQATFPDSAVYLNGWSDDWNKLLLYVTGGGYAGEYFVFDRNLTKMQKVADRRSGISRSQVAEVNVVEYKARDGLRIPSLLTWPLGAAERSNLPLIVMPHGGPEAYDAVGFDWMAQYFASRGYAVLQPNFRGSDGFGADFRLAGRGEWGRKMQDDVTDGVNRMIKAGIADPDRVCIVGASYGGYSALAGGAFTPDLYKCVVAIAPVSDLPRMLRDTKFDYGSDHWVVAYWERVIGKSDEEREKLKAVSPVNHAEAFQAPVLLIHGKDDNVVPLEQSTVMERALKRAGKDVILVKLKGEDHYLSVGETRLETLRLMSDFVMQHNPPG